MAELHIDQDWKKQAQEEKKRLAEEEAKRKQASAPREGVAGRIGGAGAPAGDATGAPRGAQREMPQASFATLVQSMMTQVLFYLGELAPRGGEPQVNLDMAKHNIDTLSMLEEKTRGNLSEEEQQLLDAALYETRMRYVSVASQYIA